MKKIKRIKEKLNKNIVLGISLLALGLVTAVGILSTGYNILASVNPFDLQAGDVTYSNSATSETTVQGAIDELINNYNTKISNGFAQFVSHRSVGGTFYDSCSSRASSCPTSNYQTCYNAVYNDCSNFCKDYCGSTSNSCFTFCNNGN